MARTGGRARSPEAHQAALTAIVELLEERGYRAVTIEGVAERSGVAKSTLYRWWRSKPELVMEAYTAAVAERVPEPDTDDLSSDLTEFVRQLYTAAKYPARIRALRGLMAEAQLDPEFEAPFRTWIQTRRTVLLHILDRARERGHVHADADLEYAVDQVFGAFWYRLLVGHAPLDPSDAAKQVSQLLRGLAVEPQPEPGDR